MFYEPAKGHGLTYDPAKAIVSPRPIAWISTRSAAGVANLAPYSFFNIVASRPFLVMFSSEGVKDTLTNIRETGEFVVNLATRALAEKVNATAIDAPAGADEFELSGLAKAECRFVSVPRVADSPAALECRMTQILQPMSLAGPVEAPTVVFGEVVGVHIDDDHLVDGRFDVERAGNLARLGYLDFSSVDATFEMRRPRWNDR